ncbi:MAG: hypothetical protein AAF902_24515 [Chloroflexota bacterium]
MDLEKEIKRLKDEEQEIEYPMVTKETANRLSININLWPLIPIVLIISAVSLFGGDGESRNIWNFWWLIFFVKPMFFGWGKGKHRGKSCNKTDGYV